MKRTLVLSIFAALAANAFAIDFENPPYNGSAGGTLLTGQDGWYLPAGSVDWNVFTYAGNTMGAVANPGGGGDQFAGGVSTGTVFGRAQKDFGWDGSTVYEVSYDVNHQYLGQLPTAQNLGSWSLQDSLASRSLIALNVWEDLTTAATWASQFNVFDAAGLALDFQSPGAAWTGLLTNHWYRVTHTIDFVNNTLAETSITDLHTNTTNTFNPVGWYLRGGSTGGGLPAPTGYRFFAGGAAGNAFALDNVNINVIPEPGTIFAVGAGLAVLVARRRRK
jgi:hypothetical protein